MLALGYRSALSPVHKLKFLHMGSKSYTSDLIPQLLSDPFVWANVD